MLLSVHQPLIGLGLLATLLLAGCQKDACEAGCTTVQGRFVTGNGQEPLQGLVIKLVWFRASGFSGRVDVREKATAVTDANGSYTLRYLLKQDEVEEGFLSAELDNTAYYGTNYASIRCPRRRDTLVVSTTYWLPRPAKLIAELTNPQDLRPNDQFRLAFRFARRPAEMPIGGTARFFTTQTTETFDLPAEQWIRVLISRSRDGVTLPGVTLDSVRLSPNEMRRYPVRF